MLQSGEVLYIPCLCGKGEYLGMLCSAGFSDTYCLVAPILMHAVVLIQGEVPSQLGLK